MRRRARRRRTPSAAVRADRAWPARPRRSRRCPRRARRSSRPVAARCRSGPRRPPTRLPCLYPVAPGPRRCTLSAMTTTEDTVFFAPSVRRQPVALCVLVGAAVAVGWVLYRHYWANDVVAAHRPLETRSPATSGRCSLVLTPCASCVPYAVALLLWGRGLARGLAGGAAALVVAGAVASGACSWVFQDYVWDSGPPAGRRLRVFLTGASCWFSRCSYRSRGVVARRSGRSWTGSASSSARSWPRSCVSSRCSSSLVAEPRVTGVAPPTTGSSRQWSTSRRSSWPCWPCWAIEARSRRTLEMESSA